MKRNLALFCCLLFSLFLKGQGTGVPLGDESYHIMDRLTIKTGIKAPFHSALKYYSRGDAASYAIQVDTTFEELTKGDEADLWYIFRDNNEWVLPREEQIALTEKRNFVYKKEYIDSTNTFYTLKEVAIGDQTEKNRYVQSKRPFLKYFYKTPANFFEVNQKAFQLKFNPVFNLKAAKAKNDDQAVFHNQRGFRLRGSIDNRVYFASSLLESQSRFPDYFTREIMEHNAIPGHGLYKPYDISFLNIDGGFDYLNAQGYVGFNATRHIGIQFGHGRNFIGNGYRSLLLSDYANNYLYLKFNTRIWKFHYQNIFGELAAQSSNSNVEDTFVPKKYFAAHHLSFDFGPNFNVGLFETVVFSRNNSFELQYLNPIILYRMVEGLIGSPDNVLLGMDFKWNLFKRYQLYGQFIFDEFKFNELIVDRNGWWANKYGVQLGLKYIDMFGIDHLDGQVEFNSIRPYTYTHRDSSASYTHYNQALAHPLGANFNETIFKLRYQPFPKLRFEGRLISARVGEDGIRENWGNDILLPHSTRVQDYGNEIGQGVKADIMIAGLDVSYELFHNTFVDLHFFYRKKDSADNERDLTSQYIGGGFRMNIAMDRRGDF